jgi:hypothetical protein
MKTQALAALMTLLPGVAAAQVKVSIGIPTVQVSVNGPQGEPPGPGYVWEPARWVNQNGAWVHQPGYWRQEAPPPPVYQEGYPTQAYPTQAYPVEATVVYAEVPPPAPIVEVRPAPPYGGAVWIAGYWNWHRGRHHWMRGRWERARAGYAWEPQRWVRQGNRWACHTGGWRRNDGYGRQVYYGQRDHDRGRSRNWDRGRDRGRDRDRDRDRHNRRHH